MSAFSRRKFSSSFLMLQRDLLCSPSWRQMSINCKRLIDFLLEEHLSKGGRENGALKATYDQLVATGISRRLIHKTISEAEDLGLIRAERGGRRGCANHISTFTVTFVRTFQNGREVQPTHDWKKVQIPQSSSRIRKNLKSPLRSVTITVPQHDHPQFH